MVRAPLRSAGNTDTISIKSPRFLCYNRCTMGLLSCGTFTSIRYVEIHLSAQRLALFMYSLCSFVHLRVCLSAGYLNTLSTNFYGRTLSERPCYILPLFFYRFFGFFMAALVGQTAERIFTKLSHVVDISCYLRTY